MANNSRTVVLLAGLMCMLPGHPLLAQEPAPEVQKPDHASPVARADKANGLVTPGSSAGLSGVWKSDGYGFVFVASGGTLQAYEVTQTTCVPSWKMSRRAESTVDVEEVYTGNGWAFGDQVLLVKATPDSNEKQLYRDGAASDIVIHRIAARPATCDKPTPNTPEGNFEVFAQTWAEHYITFDEKGANWPDIVAKARARVTPATKPEELFDIFQGMIAPFEDAHTMIIAEPIKRRYHGFRKGTDRVARHGIHDFMTKDLPPVLAVTDSKLQGPLRKWCNDQLQYAHLDDSTGYLRILSEADYTKEGDFAGGLVALEAALDAIFSDPKLERLVIDVRINFGGEDPYGLALASRLATSNYVAYSKEARMDPVDRTQWTPSQPSFVRPSTRPGFKGPVVELTGPLTISAGETMTQALMGRTPKVVRIGENTQGVFSDILGRTLPNGWVFGLPNEVFRSPEGKAFDGPGIPPDIAVPVFTEEDLAAGRDPGLERAHVELYSAWRGMTFRDCAECPEMVLVPAGDFIMGSPGSEPGRYDDEGPQRSVHVSQFAMGRFDVTRGQWEEFVSMTNRSTSGGCFWSLLPDSKPGEPNPAASWQNLGFAQDNDHPVACVTFNDAQEYLAWLSKRSGHQYRLPTEAEWEYAARAGTTSPFPWGYAGSHEFANYGAEQCCGSGVASGTDRWINTSPVGAFPPNPFGLHDMHGNVLQWVQDCYSGSYAGLPTDGSADEVERMLNLSGDLSSLSGTSSCSYRIVRGGDWGDPPALLRSAARNFAPPPGETLKDYSSTGLGFRVARSFADSADSSRAEILSTLNNYYQWVLANGETVAKSAPGIVDVPGTTKFYLDRSSEQEFVKGFMDSGIFSTEFPAAVSRYYSKYEKEFSGYSAAEFDQMAHDGRGPLMEVEDMDIFFCAQEYTYNDEYIRNMRLKDLRIEGDRASVITIFPFEWETDFKLQKVDGKWLISAFCVYE